MQKNSVKRYGQVDENPESHARHLASMVQYYAKTAQSYNTWHCNPADNSWHNHAVREILSTMRETQSRTLLDVCCGTGRAIKAALASGYDAVGVDASPDLLEIGTRDLGIPASRLIRGDATCLPYADNSFDVSCILGALHHTARPEKLVAEMIRVTRSAIIISDEGNHIPGGIRQLLISMGLFEPIYRTIFRRPPRQHKRMGVSETDGPAYVFSIEEIIPTLRSHFEDFKCLTFYRVKNFQVCSYRLPRLFARQGVITVKRKKNITLKPAEELPLHSLSEI